jgi:hypothetical protein
MIISFAFMKFLHSKGDHFEACSPSAGTGGRKHPKAATFFIFFAAAGE